jgi:hypothetical protein
VEARPRARELTVLLVAVGEVGSVPIAGASLWLARNFGQASAYFLASIARRPSWKSDSAAAPPLSFGSAARARPPLASEAADATARVRATSDARMGRLSR